MIEDSDGGVPEVDENGYSRPSKSARKREAATLQDLGVQLADLSAEEIEAIGLPEALLIAVRELRRLTSHGAQVRQRQYIGKLMRKIDPEPVLAKLAERKQRHDAGIRRFQKIERWRDRLLSEPEALSELLAEHPHADRGRLEQLTHAARRERDQELAPTAARKLFTYLREFME